MKIKMKKEIVIILVVIIAVIIGNILTQNYTRKCVYAMNKNMDSFRENVLRQIEADENVESREIKDEIRNIDSKWNSMYSKLAYYIEHDELEKVKTEIVAIQGNVEVSDYNQAIPGIDRCKFILEHIKDKSTFSIQNIF